MKKLNSFNDSRGSLVPINFSEIPFTPKRIFYVSNVPKNTIRGNHAHYKTKQYLICVSGSIRVELKNKVGSKTATLKKNDSIFVDSLVWDSQEFLEDNSILLVICSTEYDANDYIFDIEKLNEMECGCIE